MPPAARAALAGLTALALQTAPSTAAQRSNVAAVRERLADPAPMSADEIADALQAAREAAAYKTFTFSSAPAGDEGPDVLLAPDGRPIFLRTTPGSIGPRRDGVTLFNYTRQASRHCDGAPAPGELVVEYEEDPRDGWTVTARQSDPPTEPLAPIFAVLAGETDLDDRGASPVGDRPARAFAVKGSTATTPTLWIDARSFLPLRWSGGSPGERVFFVYGRPIELRVPAGTPMPTCLDPR